MRRSSVKWRAPISDRERAIMARVFIVLIVSAVATPVITNAHRRSRINTRIVLCLVQWLSILQKHPILLTSSGKFIGKK
ncbi:hypothetical protein B9Z19DRAFT_1084367 [Tuber borchii]|uniref:Uncharacterized protein n=1 Tax=Tuber borchii TaxID=42251 RepID=A0A2T6ZRY1_TUBBO|nr:hypothetical protein B9Z19DRAFT_1084367 [Tuber borchii]